MIQRSASMNLDSYPESLVWTTERCMKMDGVSPLPSVVAKMSWSCHLALWMSLGDRVGLSGDC